MSVRKTSAPGICKVFTFFLGFPLLLRVFLGRFEVLLVELTPAGATEVDSKLMILNGCRGTGGSIARVRLGSLCCGGGNKMTIGSPVTTDAGSGSARLSNQPMCSSLDILRNHVAPVSHELSRTFSSTWLPITLGLSKVCSGQPSITIPCFRVM